MTDLIIPLTVIGGFLGAGKTSLLNHWLTQNVATRMAVLVNDFGDINLDAALVAKTSGNTIALGNGCVCCQIGNDLAAAFAQVLETTPPFDAIVIEASGVSDPWRIAALARVVPELMLNGVIVVVDVCALAEQASNPHLRDTLVRQLQSADLVIGNHVDEATSEQWEGAQAVVNGILGNVPIYPATYGRVPLEILSGDALFKKAARERIVPRDSLGTPSFHTQPHHDLNPHHEAMFDTWSASSCEPLSADLLDEWFNHPPHGILRLKGYIPVKDSIGGLAWHDVQIAGSRSHVRQTKRPEAGSQIVAIGLKGDLPVDELSRMFHAPIGATFHFV